MNAGACEAGDAAREVSRYARLAYARHLVHAAGGNVSVRLKPGNAFLITASGVSLRNVNTDNIVKVDFDGNSDGNVRESKGLTPSKEFRLHTAVYVNRPDVDAVIHVHSPYATGFAIRGCELPMATASAKLKLVRVPLVEYANPGSVALADYVAAALRSPDAEEVKALLLAAHGVLAFGSNSCQAFEIAELVEETAQAAFVALTLRDLGRVIL